jgi:hypothetical protein
MAAPRGQVLGPKNYKNAQRYPFQPARAPGLDVSGAGRGCNTLKGNFVVNGVQYAGDGSVLSFSADFDQRCEGGPHHLFGAIDVNAVPHQASLTNAVIAGGAAVFTATLNPASTKSETVQFSTRDDTALAGSDYTSVSESITFAAGETEKTVRVPLLRGAHPGTQFSGLLSATTTPLWIRAGSAVIK